MTRIRHVAIIGGHGQIAQQVTRLLVADGVTVRSVIRNPAQSAAVSALGAEPVVADIERLSGDELAAALGQVEAIVFAAGAGPGSGAARKTTVDLDGSVKSITAAERLGAAHFVQISFIGAEQPTPEGTEEVFAAYWDAKRDADEALRDSALAWTIVKPGMLIDEPGEGLVAVTTGTVARGSTTGREDVAALIAAVLGDERTFGVELSVLDGDSPLVEALDAALSTTR